MCMKTTKRVDPRNAWIAKCDLEGFGQEIKDLGKQLRQGEGQADVDHLEKIMLWSNMCLFMGVALSFLPAYTLVPSVLIGVGITARWTMVAHHIIHGGYDRSKQYNRRKFAMGTFRRLLDWTDWMLPEGWAIEHNIHHHYALNEMGDPDLVEENYKIIREGNWPRPMKYALIGAFMLTWKWSYYAPSTFKLYREHELKRSNALFDDAKFESGTSASTTIGEILMQKEPNVSAVDFVRRAMLPFLVRQFIVFPALMFGVGVMVGSGWTFLVNAFCNIVLGEIMSNIHSYLIIVPNHSGKDMYRYQTSCKPRSSEFFLRQVISSANYTSGNDVPAFAKDTVDFFQGWLNYQVEHHLWPDLSMLSYQRAHPEVMRICKKYNVPFVKENVFMRWWRCTEVALGDASHIHFPHHDLKTQSQK